MSSPRLRDHLRNMLQAAREILEFVEGLDREAFPPLIGRLSGIADSHN